MKQKKQYKTKLCGSQNNENKPHKNAIKPFAMKILYNKYI